MRPLIAILLAGVLAGAAWAQLPMHAPPLGTKSAAGGAYVGPLDAVSGVTALACWSTRACSATIASALTKAMQVQVSGAGAGTDIPVKANGDLNTATLNAACGVNCTLNLFYEQIGNGYTLTKIGNAMSVSGSGCPNSKTCIVNTGGDAGVLNTSFGSITQPVTYSAVAKRTGANTSFGFIASNDDGTHWAGYLSFFTSTNTITLAGDASNFQATASDNNNHAFQAVFNGASSVVNVDGTETTGTASGTASADFTIGSTHGGADELTGYVTEVIVFHSSLSGANRTALCRNQQAYWGTANFPANC